MVGGSRKRQGGFNYLVLLLGIAIMGAALGATGEVWRMAVQREKELELLFIGDQYRLAIKRYFDATPGPVKRFPNSLEDLLQDKRFPTTQRYLRKLYKDPMTNSTDWGLVPGREGGIAGVFSKSQTKPLKVANFSFRNAAFENADGYNQWLFIHDGRTAPVPRGTPPAGGSTGAAEPPTMFPPE